MRVLLAILLTAGLLSASSQRKYLFGLVEDSVTRSELIGAHVRNLTSGNLAISDEYGKFRIPAQSGDTLLFTNVGYQQLGWIIKESWFSDERKAFALPVDTIYLDEVVIGELPEYQRFKQLIVETEPEDTGFWYHGMEKPVMEKDNVMEKKEYANPIFMATHPISFLHHAFSKKEKEKRKMLTLQRQSGSVKKAQSKFTREWVSEMTRLEGDSLTDFIAFCEFTPEYIAKTPVYIIHEKMMALLDDFMDQQSEG